jgi:hypothetical protein
MQLSQNHAAVCAHQLAPIDEEVVEDPHQELHVVRTVLKLAPTRQNKRNFRVRRMTLERKFNAQIDIALFCLDLAIWPRTLRLTTCKLTRNLTDISLFCEKNQKSLPNIIFVRGDFRDRVN